MKQGFKGIDIVLTEPSKAFSDENAKQVGNLLQSGNALSASRILNAISRHNGSPVEFRADGGALSVVDRKSGEPLMNVNAVTQGKKVDMNSVIGPAIEDKGNIGITDPKALRQLMSTLPDTLVKMASSQPEKGETTRQMVGHGLNEARINAGMANSGAEMAGRMRAIQRPASGL